MEKVEMVKYMQRMELMELIILEAEAEAEVLQAEIVVTLVMEELEVPALC